MRYCWKALVKAINSCAVDWSHEMVGIDIIGGQSLAYPPLVDNIRWIPLTKVGSWWIVLLMY